MHQRWRKSIHFHWHIFNGLHITFYKMWSSNHLNTHINYFIHAHTHTHIFWEINCEKISYLKMQFLLSLGHLYSDTVHKYQICTTLISRTLVNSLFNLLSRIYTFSRFFHVCLRPPWNSSYWWGKPLHFNCREKFFPAFAFQFNLDEVVAR